MCRTVAGITRTAPDESSDTSGTDTAELIGSDIEGICGYTGMEPWTYGYLGPRRCGVSTPRGVL